MGPYWSRRAQDPHPLRMEPAPDWMTAAMAIVNDWEQTHDGRLLNTGDAGKLVHLIAVGLASAFERGATSAQPLSDNPST